MKQITLTIHNISIYFQTMPNKPLEIVFKLAGFCYRINPIYSMKTSYKYWKRILEVYYIQVQY